MNDLLKNLSSLSIEELESLIIKAQEMIQEKRQAAERQAELEKQRQEQKQRYSMISCPQCRRLVTSGSRFCSHCGSDMTRKTKKKDTSASIVCPHCHKTNPPDSRFCLHCGGTV